MLYFGYILYPIHSINLNLLQVTGHESDLLKLEVIKKIIGVTVLLISIPYGICWQCTSVFTLTSYLALLLNTY